MKDEIFHKWCSKCGVVTTTLSAQFCPDCGDGPLQIVGGIRPIEIIVKTPSLNNLTEYGLTTVEAQELYEHYMNYEAIKLTIRINGDVPTITAVNGKEIQ